jgi:serine/threonine protein kinase/Tol biopolymer transport system component
MPFASGVRLSVYEVLELIGEGGMGEVYRAHDARLSRDVALKILPELFARDPDRLARFKREAKVLASLNHPNIAAIYGFEESQGVHALVLELVDGPTVAETVAQGPIPLHDALLIATQIAVALEAAHENGIIHRDLKPANIKVRSDGTVKVLDFGLAKALADDVAVGDVSLSPTITSPALTRMGVILGTGAYMSPEQARGKTADKRSDIWAFGCVLYEMLAGKRAYDGEDVSETLANVLKGAPDWDALPSETPSIVRRVLRRCLEKDPRRRFHDIADARLDLDEGSSLDAAVPVVVRSRRTTLERSLWALIVVTLGSVLAYFLLKEPAAQQVIRFEVNPPDNTSFGSTMGMGANPALTNGTVSPDGTRLVFVATDRSGTALLWVRPIDSLTARPVPGTDGGLVPFWSPDSRFIGFFVADKLKKIDGEGGAAQTICDVPSTPKGATWGRSGIILFSSGNSSPHLFRISGEGGTPVPLQIDDAGRRELEASWPYFLPDGRHFLYWVKPASDDPSGVYVASIEPGAAPPRRLVASESGAVYAPPGFLLFAGDGILLRQRFDPEHLQMTGEATPVVEHVARIAEIGSGGFSASATGVLTYRSSTRHSTQFAWFDRNGRMLESVGPPGDYRTPALSPDEKRLAYADDDKGDIWILDLSRRAPSRFTYTTSSLETAPVWSPDGTKIIYRSTQHGGSVFEKSATGTVAERLIVKARINGPSQVSRDGKSLLYFATPEGQAVQDIFVLSLTGEPKPVPIVQSPFVDVEPQLSPDERWLAYLSNETGRHEVYVQPFPPTGSKWQISNGGARQPLWSHDGKELFFVSDARKLYAVDIRSGSGFDFGIPRLLFELRANVFNARNSYVPSRDGQRFLVNMLLDEAASPINVVLNWTAGLKK